MGNNAHPCCKCGSVFCDTCTGKSTVPNSLILNWGPWVDVIGNVEDVCPSSSHSHIIVPSSELNNPTTCYLARILSVPGVGCCPVYYGERGLSDFIWSNVSDCPTNPTWTRELNWSRNNVIGSYIVIAKGPIDGTIIVEILTATAPPASVAITDPCILSHTQSNLLAMIDSSFFCNGGDSDNIVESPYFFDTDSTIQSYTNYNAYNGISSYLRDGIFQYPGGIPPNGDGESLTSIILTASTGRTSL